MKKLWLPLVSCLILGSLPLDDAHAQQRSMVRVALPGTIEPVILSHIGPAFTAATGEPPPIFCAPTNSLVKPNLSGQLKPKVYIRSDANPMKLFFRPAEDERASWENNTLPFRTTPP